MAVTNKDIALSIINFLKSSVAQKEIAEDYAESMDVAIDCIADAFEVDKDSDSQAIESKFGGKSLAELIKSSVSGDASAPKEVDADVKAKADELKLDGNRAMKNRDFQEAISKYSEAIALDPTNVVYLSNRAAAYSSSSQHQKAIEDAEKAVKLDPSFSKAYSRLGLAQYALGDAKAAMEAYKKGLEIEGDKKSDAMQRGYETAKRRVEEDLEKTMPSDVNTTNAAAGSSSRSAEDSNSSSAGAGGLPDFSSLFGGAGGAGGAGGSGGMPSFADMMNNPQIMQAAQQMMQNPSAMQGLLNNPALRQMAQNMGLGGEGGSGPDLSELMNNPMLQNLANQFGGAGRNNGSGNGSENGNGN